MVFCDLAIYENPNQSTIMIKQNQERIHESGSIYLLRQVLQLQARKIIVASRNLIVEQLLIHTSRLRSTTIKSESVGGGTVIRRGQSNLDYQ